MIKILKRCDLTFLIFTILGGIAIGVLKIYCSIDIILFSLLIMQVISLGLLSIFKISLKS